MSSVSQQTSPAPETKVLVELRSVSKRFGSHEVLKDVSLQVHEGEVLVIIGPSGSGKSTLLRCINFIAPPTEGVLVFAGKEWRAEKHVYNIPKRRRYEQALAELRSEIGMVFQSFNVFPHMTALQNVALGLMKVRGVPKETALQEARAGLSRLGLEDKAEHYPAQLSGGQKQRVAIARALALQPRVMLFDEATSSLDPELVSGILDEMRRLAAAGMTMVVVTHEMNFAFQVANRIVFMDQGRIVQVGTPEEIRNTTEPRARAFLDSIVG